MGVIVRKNNIEWQYINAYLYAKLIIYANRKEMWDVLDLRRISTKDKQIIF